MAPTFIIGAVAAGQAYLQPGSISDPAETDPSKSSAALWDGKIQIHPDTPSDDPVFKQFPSKANPDADADANANSEANPKADAV